MLVLYRKTRRPGPSAVIGGDGRAVFALPDITAAISKPSIGTVTYRKHLNVFSPLGKLITDDDGGAQ